MKLQFDIKACLAPLAEITDIPFRSLVRDFSSCLMFTEMISAAGAYQNNQKTVGMMKLGASEHPIGVQLFGHNPEQLATAAKMAEAAGADMIDINMGCPVKKIVSDGNGSALMKDETLAGRIVEAVAKAVSLPVSAKFRKGFSADSVNAVSFAKVLESAGASLVTVHGRTRAEFYSGAADWDIIAKVKEAVKIPVIANGDITSPEVALECLQKTKADGVMIARASLGHPWLMGQIAAAVHNEPIPATPTINEQKQIVIKHLNAMLDYYGNPSGLFQFRKHLCWYVTGKKGASKFREAINHIQDKNIVLESITKFYDDLES